ncbi:MAG: hypothetical protein MZV65_36005 [Chromatiales bacterium]|nr:hypothetical protein [Chromatiales bacterium]
MRAQFFGHGIERVGKVADLIVCPAWDTWSKVAFGDGFRGSDKRKDRTCENPGQEYGDKNTCCRKQG